MLRRSLPLLLALACTGDEPTDPTDTDVGAPDPYDVVVGPYDVSIRTTSYGIPHITAEDEGSLGHGLGHIWARNHICVLADQLLKVRSERSKYFGDAYIDGDFGWKHLRVRQQAEAEWFNLTPELRARIVGVAAGYNAHLAEVGVDGLPEPCQGADWVKPIDHIDLLSYYLSLAQWGSGYNLVELVGQAVPPGAQDGSGESTSGSSDAIVPPPFDVLEPVQEPPIGSNGWAIGRANSSTDGGMLLSNTHFPMSGERQWMEYHLTIPGELDVYGVGLVGMPLVAMGFNEHVAWTHTVSNTPRFVPYLLRMGRDRVSYDYEDGEVDLVPYEYSIEVRQSDGSLATRTRTLYDSQYGPMWNAPGIGWDGFGATYRDVNWNQTGTIPTFDGMDRATDIETFKAAHRDHQGIPWVHTMMADAEGNAFYTDSAAAPNLSDDTWAAYDTFVATNLFAQQYRNFGLPLMNGGDPRAAWTEDPAAARPGAVPFDESPQLLRDDYVTNANQNHWLANPAEKLEGYPRIYGPTGTPATTRTRMNHFYLQGLVPERGEDGVWTLDELETAALSFRSSVSELVREDVVTRCEAHEGTVQVNLGGGPEDVDIAPACAVLAAWDGMGGTSSQGAHVWREFLASGPIMPDSLVDAGPLFANAFDPADPIGTPYGLVDPPGEGPDPVLQALAIATVRIDQAGLSLDAELGDIQVRKKGTTSTPTPGGHYFEGYIGIGTYSGKSGDSTLFPPASRGAVINSETGLTDEGYVITNGNSWIMALQFGPQGPEARAVLTYSQSEDPSSPHYVDQTELYAQQSMRPILFREADIAADPNLTEETLTLPEQ